jgi:hypothetical protein
MGTHGKPGVGELRRLGVRVKTNSRVDPDDAFIIHLATAYGIQPGEICEMLEIPRTTLRRYLETCNGWTFTPEELLTVLNCKDSELDAAFHNVCSLLEVNRLQQELTVVTEEAPGRAQDAQHQAEHECHDLLGLTSALSAELRRDLADLRDQVAALNAKLREQMSERESPWTARGRWPTTGSLNCYPGSRR